MGEPMVKVVLETPGTPNFIRSIDGKLLVPIQDLSDRDLREIAKRWTALLLLKARNRRRAESPRV